MQLPTIGIVAQKCIHVIKVKGIATMTLTAWKDWCAVKTTASAMAGIVEETAVCEVCSRASIKEAE